MITGNNSTTKKVKTPRNGRKFPIVVFGQLKSEFDVLRLLVNYYQPRLQRTSIFQFKETCRTECNFQLLISILL